MQGFRPVIFVLNVLFLASSSEVAQAYSVHHAHSPGSMALHYKKRSNVWSRLDLLGIDASVTSSPPDTAKFDRRLESLGIFGFDMVLGPKFGFRVNAMVDVSKRRQAEDEGPIAYVDEMRVRYRPSIDLTFITHGGLEVFAGAMRYIAAPFEQSINSETVDSTTRFSIAQMTVPRVGVVRRGGVWSGGFYYNVGKEIGRGFEKTSSDGSSFSGTDTIHEPTEVAVFGEFDWGMFAFDFEVATVEAGEGGLRSDDGTTIKENYLRGAVNSFTDLGGLGLKVGLAHQTLSYSSNSFMSLDTIPVSTLRIKLILGGPDAHSYVGLVGARGRDGQSIPEFNAKYDLKGIGTTIGMFMPL